MLCQSSPSYASWLFTFSWSPRAAWVLGLEPTTVAWSRRASRDGSPAPDRASWAASSCSAWFRGLRPCWPPSALQGLSQLGLLLALALKSLEPLSRVSAPRLAGQPPSAMGPQDCLRLL